MQDLQLDLDRIEQRVGEREMIEVLREGRSFSVRVDDATREEDD